MATPIPIASVNRDQTIVDLFRDGWTSPELAQKFGVSPQRISQILKANGIDSNEGGLAVRKQARKRILESIA